MITLISPAKKLDYLSDVCTEDFTIPEGLDRSALLVNKLQKTSKKKFSELMSLSDNLTNLNVDRYAAWSDDFTEGELIDFLQGMDIKMFSKMKDFFDTAPKMTHELNYVNKEGNDRTIKLEGISDFF